MFVMDTHAGAGRHDLESSEAIRGNEADDGIGKVLFDLIRTSVYDKCSGSMKITTHLYHISHFTNWSNRWTYRVE